MSSNTEGLLQKTAAKERSELRGEDFQEAAMTKVEPLWCCIGKWAPGDMWGNGEIWTKKKKKSQTLTEAQVYHHSIQ